MLKIITIKKVSSKIELMLSHIMKGTLIIAIFSPLHTGKWIIAFLSILALFLTFLPSIIAKNYKIILPTELELTFVVFIYSSIFLGEVYNFYEKYVWWDLILHTISGISFGLIGFILIFILYKGKKLQASPVLISIFSFSFSMATGAIWEIFEFFMDMTFGLNMQKSGLVDTMADLIVNAIGAFIIASFGYIYVKYNKANIVQKLINRFVKKNPNLFKDNDFFK